MENGNVAGGTPSPPAFPAARAYGARRGAAGPGATSSPEAAPETVTRFYCFVAVPPDLGCPLLPGAYLGEKLMTLTKGRPGGVTLFPTPALEVLPLSWG